MFSSTINSTQLANELEHLELMVFTSPFVIFFLTPTPSSLFLSLACHRCFSLSLQQTGIYWQEEKARSSPGERSTKPAVCMQQMQKASPSATGSLRHMGFGDFTQEGTFVYLFIYYICRLTVLCHRCRIKHNNATQYPENATPKFNL